jgi:hypothetical protein
LEPYLNCGLLFLGCQFWDTIQDFLIIFLKFYFDLTSQHRWMDGWIGISPSTPICFFANVDKDEVGL